MSYTQKSLVRRPLVFRDGRLDQATLFPMFDSEGEVLTMVIVDHLGARLFAQPWSPGLVWKPWFRALHIDCSLESLEELSAKDAYEISDLWHYDPWSLLAAPEFARNSATPYLQHTNCADHLKGVNFFFFDSALAGASSVFVHRNGQALSVMFADLEMPEPVPYGDHLRSWGSRGREIGEWQLRPFWNRQLAL